MHLIPLFTPFEYTCMSPLQEMGQRFTEVLEEVRHCQNLLVNRELANWKHSQRLFNWEDDRGKVELNTMQQW